VAWTSSAYPPDFAFHPEIIEVCLDAIEAGSEPATPQIVREILGPEGTIAKENRERKEKSRKKAGKMGFLGRGCGNPR
jgi:hypothetical protein